MSFKVYLEHGKTGLPEVVKSTPRLFILEATTENLHSQECKNEYEENQEN